VPAAIEHAFADTPPQRLYLDTDFVIAALIDTEPHHARCSGFLKHVADLRLTRLYVSSLWWLEFIDTVTRQQWRDRLPPGVQQQFQLHHWQQSLVRQHYVQWMVGRLEEILAPFEWAEVSINRSIRTLAVQYMGEYALRGQDATHLAAMAYAGVYDLASLDEKFRKVDGLHLWNDRIHGS
jgi:predicted nucleic acid-binding protein